MSDSGPDAPRSTPSDGAGKTGYGSVTVDSPHLDEGAIPGEGTPDEQRIRDLRDLLEQTGFYDSITLLYQAYDAAETPDEIEHIEAYDGRPTPGWL